MTRTLLSILCLTTLVSAGCAGSSGSRADRPDMAERYLAAPSPLPAPAVSSPTGYVRLRGSVEIHRVGCPVVARAHPDGIVPARLGDGEPCLKCLRSHALSKTLAPDGPATFRPAAVAAPARVTPVSNRFVRLRGSIEVHRSDCPRVLRADPDGIVPASLGDGPPCFTCLRERALSWKK